MILEDCRLIKRDLVETLDISLDTVSSILKEVLGFKNCVHNGYPIC